MPKGLIPLIGGLGVAGTMVGISIPSAITVVPKKEKTPPVDSTKYTGYVYNGKIYKTPLLAKTKLVDDLNKVGPKTQAKDGITKYTIDAIDGTTLFTQTYSPTDRVPTPATLKTNYSWGNTPIRTTPEESTILSLDNIITSDPSLTQFSDFVYSDSISNVPSSSIAKIDLQKYSYRQTIISGGRIYSSIDDKYYWYKNLTDMQANGIRIDPTHGETVDVSLKTNTLSWGEVPTDASDGKKCILAVRFLSASNHSLTGPYIYIYSKFDWKKDFEKRTFTYLGKQTTVMDLLFKTHVYGGTDLRPGHAGTYTYALNKTIDNSKVGEKTTGSASVPSPLSDSNIHIDASQSVVALSREDWTVSNLTAIHLSKIQKVTIDNLFADGDTYNPPTISAPYIYNEEVLND